jgi:GNAT superfamily N-acetyltransferase
MISWLVSFKRAFPGLWNGIERANGALFKIWWRSISQTASGTIAEYAPDGFSFSMVEKDDLPSLSAFLEAQPEDSFQFFRPHLFDMATLTRLWKNSSFLMMKATDSEGRIIGYYFLRCFFVGVAFAGLIVDEGYRNLGLGRRMWASCMRVCHKRHLRMFATVSSKNIPSLRSCSHGTDMKILRQMKDDYLMIECKIKQ